MAQARSLEDRYRARVWAKGHAAACGERNIAALLRLEGIAVSTATVGRILRNESAIALRHSRQHGRLSTYPTR